MILRSKLRVSYAGKNQVLVIANRMEAQLKEYRARQRRQALLDSAKQQYEKSKEKLIKMVLPKAMYEDTANRGEEHESLMEKEAPSPPPQPGIKPIQPFDMYDLSDGENDNEITIETKDDNDKQIRRCRFCISRSIVYLIIWTFTWGIFLHYQFGAVYFVISALIAIYLNTRTRPKREGEVSAYSVFNKNCASIEGSLNPEQFEREIRYGIGHAGTHMI
ncbi:hypothetical protein PYW07_007724 [Mythimna separata]|uniref:SAYSvFN domain-containing protein n=1 Tax=Mythimna separata TaxID=271217 RepID=A0AAD7YQ30_MYTSE|nr:hypothetical protein PYW07_007724 [Mythimna separata]